MRWMDVVMKDVSERKLDVSLVARPHSWEKGMMKKKGKKDLLIATNLQTT